MIKQLYNFLIGLRTKLAKRFVSNVLLTPEEYRYATNITSALVVILILISISTGLIALLTNFDNVYAVVLLLILHVMSAALADVIYRSNILDFEYQRKLRAIKNAKHISKHIDFDNTMLTLDEIDSLYESIRSDVPKST
jgi:small-conductance mechanosensitive channel